MIEDADTRVALREVLAAVREQLAYEDTMGTPGLLPIVAESPKEPPARAASLPVVHESPVAEVAKGVEAAQELRRLTQAAVNCTACELHKERTRSVFARGNPAAPLMFVGEGPGRDEDLQGLPFVGAAGKLLDRMIAAMGFTQDEVYICNVVKCRPPGNRTPRPEEALACAQFLRPQIDLVAPQVIVALGRCAAEHLGLAEATGPWRGRWGNFQGFSAMATYHPAFLLRTPEAKKVVWEDLQKVMARFGRKPPAPTRR